MDYKNRREILKYTGDASQLFGVREFTLRGGKAEGVRAMEVTNGTGLAFTVLADRGMDIAQFSYKGLNCSFLSKTGIVGPEFYSQDAFGFHRSFFAGFLTTCGLRSVGSPSVEGGEEFVIHGRISQIPAEEVYGRTEWTENGPVITVGGKMREARFFGEHMTLTREISVEPGSNLVHLHDTVENNGFREEPLMLLYHFNMGYPLLDAGAYFSAPSEKVTPRDEEAAAGVDAYRQFQPPTPNYREQVFYHDLRTDADGSTYAALVNPDLELAVVIRFRKDQLGRLTQWKQPGEGEYVLGIEPCNCKVEGREKARKDGSLEIMKPGEIRKFDLRIEVVEGLERIRQLGL